MKKKRIFSRLSLTVMAAMLLSAVIMPGMAMAAPLPPVITPSGGTFTTAQSVAISNIANGDTAYYTVDSSDPTSSTTSAVYSSAFTVSQSQTVKAAIHDPLTGWSIVSSAIFEIKAPELVEAPVISPNGGSFTSAQNVTIANIASNDTAYYTTDGSDPTTSNTAVPYAGMFTVSESKTIKAAVHDSLNGWSSVVDAAFVIDTQSQVEPPVISPAGGTFDDAQNVILNNISSADTAYYTIDGSNPTSSSTAVPYAGGFTVSDSLTVKAAAHDAAYGWSTVASASFVIGNGSDSGSYSDQIAQLKQDFATAVSSNKMAQAQQILKKIQLLVKQGSIEDSLNKLKEELIAAVNDNKWAKAEAILKKIIKADGSQWAYAQLGQIYQQEGNNNVNVFSNGEQLDFDVQPIIVNGRTMIPIRKVANALGLSDDKVKWSNDGTVTINNGSNEIIIRVNAKNVYLNGTAYNTDVPAQVCDGRMMVPLRAVSQLFNKNVQWYPQGQIVTIQ